MASKEGDSEHRESKTWVLKVSIHCEGCKKKVRKILQRINGVDTIEINSQKNQVIVTGNVEAETLIRKLLKSGKHSELWPTEKKPENPKPKNNNTNNEKIVKDKNEAKEVASEPTEPAKIPETKPDTSTSVAKTETDKESEVEIKPEETRNKPNKQTTEMKQPEEESVEKDEKTAESGKERDEKNAENDSKPNDGEKKKKKKKEKKVVETEDRSIDVTPPMHQNPIYHQPMYVSSYNMAQPTQSYAHVVPTPQNYASSMNPPPQVNPNFPYPNYPNYPGYSSYEGLNHPPQEQYLSYNPSNQPNYYPMNYPSYTNEDFHGSMRYEASSSSSQQGSYDYFNDENPNSCNVM